MPEVILPESTLSSGQGEILKPYVPRLLIEWMHDAPDVAHHARDGSLAFVDISGFTALTEQLAGRGTIGNEILRDTLDRVFGALLDEAYRWGAGLLKWGGDALLLLFDGPAHAERAACAAWAMQRTIVRVGRVRVGSKTITLRMSAGVSTGTVDFFTAGSIHRELLVVGPTASEAVEVEAIADAGEVALSPALAALLDPACIGARKEDALLLAAPPNVSPDRSPDVGEVDAAKVAACIPVAALEHVLLERSESEHRMITACFVELMRTDELLARIGPVAFGEALEHRIRSIQEAAVRYEVPFNVTDVAQGSVKVLLTAGAPSTTGHDEEQTLRLAREIMDEPGTIPIRVGIASGRVFTGHFGPPYRRTYVVLGDAINTAARVMARAGAGDILAVREVLDRSRTTFAATAVEPFRAKGKAEEVRASLVGEVTGRRGDRIADTPFVGRERERAALAAILEDVVAGRGWSLEIGGPSGIGKSRLVQELLAERPEMRVLRSTCEEYESSTPYYALRDPARSLLGLSHGSSPAESERLLRKAVAETDPTLAPWVPLLGILLGLNLPATTETRSLDERFLRDAIADSTLRFLAAMLRGAPLALIVEDAQFVDEASADLLRRLAHGARSLPWALVVARTGSGELRVADDEELRSASLELLPLDQREAVQLIELSTDTDPLLPHEVEELARRSGGSPLFVVELLNVVRSAGTDVLPSSLEAVVTADIDRLAPSDRIVLRYASVAGITFDEGLLAQALQEEATLDDAVWERLHGLVDRDSSGRLRFRNSLVHDAAYEGLPFRRRRELHGRVAEAIVASTASLDDEAASLALHFSRTNRHAQTWEYARLAADRAREVAAHVEAARLYELALRAGRYVRSLSRRDRADVHIALGSVHRTAGMFDRALGDFRRATQLLPDDPVRRARAYGLRALILTSMGSLESALRDAAVGLRLIDGDNSTEATASRASLLSIRAQVRSVQGRAREAIALAQLAVEAARRSDEPDALGRAYGVLDEAYRTLGEPDKAVYGLLAVDLYRKLGQTRRVGVFEMNLGHQAQWAGRWDEAIDLLRRARADCTAAGDRQAAAGAGVTLGEVLVNRGSFADAESVLRDSRRVLRATGLAPFALLAETQLARILLEQGRPGEAFESLGRTLDEMGTVGPPGFVLEVALHFASAARAAGVPADGIAALDAAVAQARDDIHAWGVPIDRARGALLAALGRPDEARECLDRALEAARRQSLLYEQLLSMRELSALARTSGEQPSSEELREQRRLAQLLGIVS